MTIHQYRKTVTTNCEICGIKITGLKTKKTCSNKCRQIKKNRKKEKKMRSMIKKIKQGRFDIEATDMGDDQDEIANWVSNYLFENPEEVDANGEVDHLVTPACEALGWHSVPQNGGLYLNIW